MLAYYFQLGMFSLRRNPVLTALMVMTIGFGVAASMTTYSVFRAVSGDPIPWKSSKLFVPQIDMWGPQSGAGNANDREPPNALDYTDALALMRAHRAVRQSALYRIQPSVVPAQAGTHPISVSGHAVSGEFFPMVDAPFRYGSGWSRVDDERRMPVVVISDKLNRRAFGDANSVGRMLDVEGRPYRVVGVLASWNPQPRFYDIYNTQGFSDQGDDLFMPFTTAIDIAMPSGGGISCNEASKESGFAGMLHSNCIWITFLVELADATQAADYGRFLDGYAHEQQQTGRFTWAPNNRLRDVQAFLDFQHVVPSDTRVSLLVALGLLAVCLVNTSGLLLAKFLRRAPEIGVRRALGASRGEIYLQFLSEASMVGLAGGALGLLLTGVGVACVGWVLPSQIAQLARLDVSLLLLTLLVAVVATIVAGFYPVALAARVQPAWQLKSN